MVNENPNTIDKPHYEEKSVARFFDKNKILFILIGIAIAIAIIRYVSIFFMPDVFSDEIVVSHDRCLLFCVYIQCCMSLVKRGEPLRLCS